MSDKRETVQMVPMWGWGCPECGHQNVVDAPVTNDPETGEEVMGVYAEVTCDCCDMEYSTDYPKLDSEEESSGDGQ